MFSSPNWWRKMRSGRYASFIEMDIGKARAMPSKLPFFVWQFHTSSSLKMFVFGVCSLQCHLGITWKQSRSVTQCGTNCLLTLLQTWFHCLCALSPIRSPLYQVLHLHRGALVFVITQGNPVGRSWFLKILLKMLLPSSWWNSTSGHAGIVLMVSAWITDPSRP